ncbi:hypothetical protein Hanom_Chr06g00568061 [Helianthus anomalus]
MFFSYFHLMVLVTNGNNNHASFILQNPTEPPLSSHFFPQSSSEQSRNHRCFPTPILCSTSLTNYLLNPQVSLERKRSRRKIHIAGKNHTPPETESEPCWNSKTTSEPAGGPDAPEIEEASRNCGSSFRYIFSFSIVQPFVVIVFNLLINNTQSSVNMFKWN